MSIDTAEVVRLYKSGLLQKQIAEKFGYTQSGIGLILRKAGVKCKDHREMDWPDSLVAQMRQWYEVEGLTVEEVGERTGRGRICVNKAMRRFGFAMRRRGPKSGPLHTGWKGGRRTDKKGYVLVYMPDHPQANNLGLVREHRIVAEKMLGRPLLRTEVVHHKDDDPANNDPSNLQVFASNTDHLAATLKGKAPKWTEAGKERIAAGILKSLQQRATRHQQKARDAAKSK